ncbi:MAG: aldo/keto reductase family oxidoreductase [Spartobacteria bacterium]
MNPHRITLSPKGPNFSRLAYGIWRLAEDPRGSSPSVIREKVDACLEKGITTFDHADIYGLYTCEELFGNMLRESPGLRDSMEIVTKSGINVDCPQRPGPRVKHYNATGKALVRCLEDSLKKLGTDHVDLLLVHRPDCLTSADDTADGLNRLLRDGKIRAAGVSNYNVHQFSLLNARMDQPLATNQVEFNPFHLQPIEDGVFDQCQGLGLSPMVWSPTAGGRVFDPTDSDAIRLSSMLADLSQKYEGATPDQLLYAWVLALPCRPVCILGTNRIDRIQAAAAALDITLAREDWFAIWEAACGREIP